MFRALRNRNYRIYAIGSAVSISGTWMQRIAQDWLIVELGGGGLALGISVAAQFMPLLLFGVWGGLVVDRADRRKLLLVTQTAQAVLAVFLAAATVSGIVNLPVVYAIGLALGVVSIFDGPGRQVLIADMVSREDLPNAQALYSSVYNAGRFVGPGIAGVVIASAGVGPAFLINAASFVAVLLSIFLLDLTQLNRPPPLAKGKGQVREALVYAWRDKEMRGAFVVVTVVDVFGQNFRVMLPLLAIGPLAGGPGVYGNLMAGVGVGAVIGAFVGAALPGRTIASLLASTVMFGVVNLVLVGTTSIGLTLVLMAFLGFANVLFNNFARGLLILAVEPNMQGRVMGLYALLSRGGTPIGGPVMGVVCAVGGVRLGFAVAGIGTLLSALVLVPFAARGRRENSSRVLRRGKV